MSYLVGIGMVYLVSLILIIMSHVRLFYAILRKAFLVTH